VKEACEANQFINNKIGAFAVDWRLFAEVKGLLIQQRGIFSANELAPQLIM